MIAINQLFCRNTLKTCCGDVGTRIAGLIALCIVPSLNLTVMAISLGQLSHGSSTNNLSSSLISRLTLIGHHSFSLCLVSFSRLSGRVSRKLVTERRRKLVSARILYLRIVNGFYPLTTFRLFIGLTRFFRLRNSL